MSEHQKLLTQNWRQYCMRKKLLLLLLSAMTTAKCGCVIPSRQRWVGAVYWDASEKFFWVMIWPFNTYFLVWWRRNEMREKDDFVSKARRNCAPVLTPDFSTTLHPPYPTHTHTHMKKHPIFKSPPCIPVFWNNLSLYTISYRHLSSNLSPLLFFSSFFRFEHYFWDEIMVSPDTDNNYSSDARKGYHYFCTAVLFLSKSMLI